MSATLSVLECTRTCTVPEIVSKNRIIKIVFDIIEEEVKIIKCSISMHTQMYDSRNFPTFKWKICIEFALLTKGNLRLRH